MKEYKYSIIIPIYNCEKYLSKCLKSLIAQSYANIEIILINDGSVDKSKEICKRFVDKDKRIKYFEQNNSGVSAARNNGIDVATGNYIIFVDSDDYIDKDLIQKLNNIVNKYEGKVEIIKYGYYKKYKFIKKKYTFSINTNEMICKENFKEKINPYISSTFDLSNIWNAMFKKDIIGDIRFDSNLKYAEDYKFMIETVNKANNIYCIDDCLYYYVSNLNSAIHNKENNIKKILDNIKVNIYIYDSFDISKDLIIDRIKKNMYANLLEISIGKNFEEYKKIIEKFINHEDFKKCYKDIYNRFEIDIFENLADYSFYKELKKKHIKLKIRDMLLKII